MLFRSLGKHSNKVDDQPDFNSKTNLTENTYLRNKQFVNEMEKKIVFTIDKAKESLLDENQLRD